MTKKVRLFGFIPVLVLSFYLLLTLTCNLHMISLDLTAMSDLIGRIAQMNSQSLEAELTRVNQEYNSSKESLHEAVYESGVLFLKAAEWTSKLKGDFENMLSTLLTVQREHDFILSLTAPKDAPR